MKNVGKKASDKDLATTNWCYLRCGGRVIGTGADIPKATHGTDLCPRKLS